MIFYRLIFKEKVKNLKLDSNNVPIVTHIASHDDNRDVTTYSGVQNHLFFRLSQMLQIIATCSKPRKIWFPSPAPPLNTGKADLGSYLTCRSIELLDGPHAECDTIDIKRLNEINKRFPFHVPTEREREREIWTSWLADVPFLLPLPSEFKVGEFVPSFAWKSN